MQVLQAIVPEKLQAHYSAYCASLEYAFLAHFGGAQSSTPRVLQSGVEVLDGSTAHLGCYSVHSQKRTPPLSH